MLFSSISAGFQGKDGKGDQGEEGIAVAHPKSTGFEFAAGRDRWPRSFTFRRKAFQLADLVFHAKTNVSFLLRFLCRRAYLSVNFPLPDFPLLLIFDRE